MWYAKSYVFYIDTRWLDLLCQSSWSDTIDTSVCIIYINAYVHVFGVKTKKAIRTYRSPPSHAAWGGVVAMVPMLAFSLDAGCWIALLIEVLISCLIRRAGAHISFVSVLLFKRI